MKHHDLKIKECYFHSIVNGNKRFEVRYNLDRDFQVGDAIYLTAVNDDDEQLGFLPIQVKINYITNFKQDHGYVVFGFDIMKEGE